MLGLLALSIALFQLLEARRKRHVDIYWELMDRYLSPEGREARNAMRKVETELGLVQRAPLRPRSSAARTHEMKLDAAREYNERYHERDADDRSRVHPAVLYRLRYLNQAGVLLRKRLVDRDLLLGLISAGVNIDRVAIDVTLTAVREHEGFLVYPHVDDVLDDVDAYVAKPRAERSRFRVWR